MIATILTAALLAQSSRVEVKEDPITHKQTTTLRLEPIGQLRGGDLDLLIHYYGGVGERKGLPPETKLSLHFVGTADTWQFLKFRTIMIADGPKSLNLGEPEHDGEVMKGGHVIEQFTADMTLGELARLSAEPNLKGRCGGPMWQLSDNQQMALRQFVQRLQQDEADYRKVESARLQAERERIEPMKAEWAAARKKAESDAKRGSKSLYTKNLARNLERAEEAFRDKNQLTVPEFKKITGEK